MYAVTQKTDVLLSFFNNSVKH